MIHTKELRFGNKVRTRQGKIITVQQLLCNTLIYDSQIEVNREVVTAGRSYGTDYITQLNEIVKEVEYSDVDPIILTADVLQKCGFRNYLREQWILRIGNQNIDFEFMDGGLRLRNPAPSLATIKHLHQLQNFLFAITTHELEVAL